MLGPRYSSLFKSRWMALLWGILICLSAIQFVGTDKGSASNGAENGGGDASAETDATGQPIKPEDVTALKRAFGN